MVGTLGLMGCGPGGITAAVAVSYTGPGDVVSGAAAWWGLRAYSAAKAGTSCVRLIRASDSTQQTFATLANGNLDVASITTFLAATTGKVVTLFDQTGAGFDVTQGTDANRPSFILNALGSLPCVRFDASATQFLAASGSPSVSYPQWISYVAKRTGNTSAFNAVMKISAGGANVGFANSSGNIYEYAGVVRSIAASENAVHAVQNYIPGSGNGFIYLDGSNNDVGGSPGTTAYSGDIEISGDGAGQNLTGDFFEVGVWSGDKSASNSAMNSNQHTYWGF